MSSTYTFIRQLQHRAAMRAKLPEAWWAEWFATPEAAQQRFGGITSLEVSPSIMDYTFATGNDVMCWDAWILVQNPSFPLLCLEDPCFPVNLLEGYLQAAYRVILGFKAIEDVIKNVIYRALWTGGMYQDYGGDPTIAAHCYYGALQEDYLAARDEWCQQIQTLPPSPQKIADECGIPYVVPLLLTKVSPPEKESNV